VAVVHQELDAVLFGGDGVIGDVLQHFRRFYADFVAAGQAGGAIVFSFTSAGDDERGFLPQPLERLKQLIANFWAKGDALSHAAAVAQAQEDELAFVGRRGAALETVEGRTTLYRPLPPQILLERQAADHQQLLQDLGHGLNALYTATADNRVWTISGRTAVLAYASTLIREAQTELYLVLTDADLSALHADVVAAGQRGLELNTLLTGSGTLDCGRVAYHPPLESELQGITATLLVQADNAEVLIASAGPRQETTATLTRNQDLVLIARQFVWMEMFTQRIYARLGDDLLARLDPEDRAIFDSLG
jgi:HTH-type transcriptional regulator, sugar sensing transcriptional regulator